MTHKQQSYIAVACYSFSCGAFTGLAIAFGNDGLLWLLSIAFGVVALAGVITEGRTND